MIPVDSIPTFFRIWKARVKYSTISSFDACVKRSLSPDSYRDYTKTTKSLNIGFKFVHFVPALCTLRLIDLAFNPLVFLSFPELLPYPEYRLQERAPGGIVHY